MTDGVIEGSVPDIGSIAWPFIFPLQDYLAARESRRSGSVIALNSHTNECRQIYALSGLFSAARKPNTVELVSFFAGSVGIDLYDLTSLMYRK